MKRLGLVPLVLLLGCEEQPECASSDYGGSECRVEEENEGARLSDGDGVLFRFLPPDATDPSLPWIPGGRLYELEDGSVRARVVGPGDFALRVEQPTSGTAVERRLVLDNVALDAVVRVESASGAVEVPADPVGEAGPLRRAVTLPAEDAWVRGTTPCPEAFRIAVVGDIQENLAQFEHIVAALADEAADAAAAGEPLLGLFIPGDLAHFGTAEELVLVDEVLARAPVPSASTPGNHDIYATGEPVYSRVLGPGNHVTSLCGLRVANLDTGDGGLAPSIEARLPELLERGDAAWLMANMHYPPYSGRFGNGWVREDQQHRLLAELAAQDADMVLAGHVHNLVEHPSVRVGEGALRQLIAGTGGSSQGIGTPRYGFLRVRLGGDTDACFVEVPEPGTDGAGPQRSDEPPLCD